MTIDREPAIAPKQGVEQPLHPKRSHEDRHVHYSHEMSEDTNEASGRFIIRVVPLLYALVVGLFVENMLGALLIGLVISVGLDLTMGKQSLFRPLLKPLFNAGCPVIALLSQAVKQGLSRIGLPVPGVLNNIGCGA